MTSTEPLSVHDQITVISRRQTLYLRALNGRLSGKPEDGLQLALYLVSRTVQSGELSPVDRRMLLEDVAHAGIAEPEKLQRFYLAVLEAQILGAVSAPAVVAAATRLLRP